MRVKGLLLLLAGMALAGCGPAPEEKAEGLLKQGDTTALSVLVAEQLQKNPASPYFNGIKALDLLQDCVAKDCGASPDLTPLQAIKTHLEKVPAEVKVGEVQKRFFHHDMGEQFIAYALANPMSTGMQNLIQLALPDALPTAPLATQLADEAYTQLLNDKLAPTTQMLNAVVQLGGQDGHTSGAQMVLNVLTGNISSLTTAPAPAPESIYTTMLPATILAYLKQTQPAGFAQPFLEALRTQPLTLANTPLALLNTPVQQKAFGQGVADLANTEGYAKILGTNLTAPADVANPNAYAQAITLKAALRSMPDDASLWQQFMPAALAAVKHGTSLGMLYDGIDLNRLTAPIAQSNNDALFAYMDKILPEGANISPALKEIIYRPDAAQETYVKKAEDALTRALDAAITQNKTATILAYIEDQGNLLAGRETQVAQALQASLNDLWLKNDFTTVKTVATLLEGKLKLRDFDLSRQANQWLTQLLASDAVKQKLIGNTFVDLILPLEQAKADLEPKIGFIKEVLIKQPEIIQNQLQAAAADNSTGNYGLPRALMAFYPYLNDKTRDTLLSNALLMALRRDDTLTPADIASQGSQFMEANPILTGEGLVAVMIERAKTFEETRAAWAAASGRLRETASKLKPQFAALQLAMDAHTAGDKSEAAHQLSLVTDAPYIDYAKPYLEEYRAILLPYAGTYLSDKISGSTTVVAIQLAPGDALLSAKLQLVNAVGRVKSQEALVSNFGNLYRSQSKATLEPRSMTLTLDTTTRDASLGNFSFEKVYGPAEKIKVKEGVLELVDKNDKAATFKRITTLDAPQGSFTVKKVLGTDTEAKGLLPQGTQFTFAKAADKISVNITLPGGINAVTTASFNPNTLALDFSFPYSADATSLEAVVRCQVFGSSGVCAAHNRHWATKRYSHVVELTKN